MYSNKLAEAFAKASETDKVELAHFLANNLDSAEQARDSARIRDYVAAFDRFAAPREGERF
ncbi:hypothetical protein ACDP63_14135 [Paracoccus sp. P2]|uniref:Uncharacterized protein n=1 Tax=Paracoccus pantotrophus TaxID=82367 RepID=A0A1I5EZ79_PARPN|nr:hypothetical protein [Paracoccus pantotrophus]MDF3853361.1 hypothetical protein [Paracoccus pantotrophus]QFG37075.1 hypothetical protein ESD82_12885 [Paracoccus pantotrophus]QLH14647.1 hypothetical protein HYQ43_10065 [Paracoccus pantotrophus]RDD96789.1 hypothetical protein DTW92_10880 [Paracoccus pantotrophus]RKS52506.1 hypothetical protein BDE18_1833 [Paracoccus pantotrophus]